MTFGTCPIGIQKLRGREKKFATISLKVFATLEKSIKCKVPILWEDHKIMPKSPNCLWHSLEYMNFKLEPRNAARWRLLINSSFWLYIFRPFTEHLRLHCGGLHCYNLIFTKSIFWKCAQFLSAQSINNFGIKWIFLYRVQRSISNVWLIDYKASFSRKPKPLIDQNETMIQLHHKNCTAHLRCVFIFE